MRHCGALVRASLKQSDKERLIAFLEYHSKVKKLIVDFIDLLDRDSFSKTKKRLFRSDYKVYDNTGAVKFIKETLESLTVPFYVDDYRRRVRWSDNFYPMVYMDIVDRFSYTTSCLNSVIQYEDFYVPSSVLEDVEKILYNNWTDLKVVEDRLKTDRGKV